MINVDAHLRLLKNLSEKADVIAYTHNEDGSVRSEFDLNKDVEWLIDQVRGEEEYRKNIGRLYKSWQRSRQKELSLCAENQRLEEKVEMLDLALKVSGGSKESSVLEAGKYHNLKVDNNHYRETLESIRFIQEHHRTRVDYEVLGIVNRALGGGGE